MHTARKAGIAIQIAAVLWAGLLALAGLWILARGPAQLPVPTLVVLGSGIALLGSAQFIYMTLFADRLFPHVHPVLRIVAELLSFFMFVVGSCLAAVFLVRAW